MYASDFDQVRRPRAGQVIREMAVDEHQRDPSLQRARVRRTFAEICPADGRRVPVVPPALHVRVHVIVTVRQPVRERLGPGHRRVQRGRAGRDQRVAERYRSGKQARPGVEQTSREYFKQPSL